MAEQERIVIQTHWVDDGKGGLKPVEIKYIEKDKGDCTVLTPIKKDNNENKETENNNGN